MIFWQSRIGQEGYVLERMAEKALHDDERLTDELDPKRLTHRC
jgi:hypothetical protein